MSVSEQESRKQALQQLLRSRRGAAPARTDVQTADYDWSAPHHFTSAQRVPLEAFAADAAGRIGAALHTLLRSDLSLQVKGLAEKYGRDLRVGADAAEEYSVALSAAGNTCGALILSAATATEWIEQLLGSSAGPKGAADRKLSAMESSLLDDLFGAIAHGISAAVQTAGAPPLATVGAVAPQRALPGEESEEFCIFEFAPAEGEGSSALSAVIISRYLEALVGRRNTPASAADARAVIMRCLQTVPVRGQVLLGDAVATMGQVLSLEAGDVLLLQKKTDGLIDLIIDGRLAASGFPVTCAGRYAMQVASAPGLVRK